MPPTTVVMAPTISRSSLELMLDMIQKRDEQPKDVPPALPARPTSRGRLPSSRRSLPVNFRIGSIAPEPVSKDSKNLAKMDRLEDSSLPQLESLEEVAATDLALEEKFGCGLMVDSLLKKIADSEDAECNTLQQIIGVQKCFRGIQARRHYSELKKGVATLQSFIRGERARDEFMILLTRWKAAVVIQRCVKGWIARTLTNKKELIELQPGVNVCVAKDISKNLKMPNLDQANASKNSYEIVQNMKNSNTEHLWVHHSVMEELQMRILNAEASLQQKEDEHMIFQQQLKQYEMKIKSMEEMWQKKLTTLQDSSERHLEVSQPFPTELQRMILKAEAALRQKEEENFKLQEQLQQYETRWSEYDAKMKSMEDMWQKQMQSLQLSLAAARKSLADDDLVSRPEKLGSSLICHFYESESTLSTEARSPVLMVDKQPQGSSSCVGGKPDGKLNEVSLLAEEFDHKKQVFEDSAGHLIAAKSQQLNSSMNPDEELRNLKVKFALWEKDYKIRLREAKSAIKKLGNARSEKPRKKWWLRGTS